VKIADAKRRLRDAIGLQRRALSAEARAAAGAAVARYVLTSPEYRSARRVAAYAALSDEVPTEAIVGRVLESGRTLLLPRMIDSDRFEFVRVARLDALRRGHCGVLEPPADAASVELGADDLVLLPGVAFDRRGGRLGRGQGCYDRSLPAGDSRPVCFGLAFAFQLVDSVPQASHDREVDAVVTESGLVRMRPPKRREVAGDPG
jgi:5-formyltetrahydrofolate cyclo-ligase